MSIIWDVLKIKIRIKQLIFTYQSIDNNLLIFLYVRSQTEIIIGNIRMEIYRNFKI